MTINVRWADETQTIVLFEVVSKWGWEDLQTAMSELYTLQSTVGHPVHSIVDMRQYNRIPLNALAFGRHKMNQPMRNGMVIFVGATFTLQAVFDILTRVYQGVPEKIRFCDTLEQALALANAQVAIPMPVLDSDYVHPPI